jgi:hypothetical protein
MSNELLNPKCYASLGRFDICSTRLDWQLVLRVGTTTLSVLFDSEEERDISDLLPSEILSLLEEGLNDKRIWRSNNAELLDRANKIREVIGRADCEWAERRVEQARKDVERWESVLASAKNDALEASQ